MHAQGRANADHTTLLLNTYTKLKEPPLLKADAQELNPDVNTPEQMPAFHNYLDEFLQAVRVFGFLEKPVSPFKLCIACMISWHA